MISKSETVRLGFFSNLINSFRISFYRQAAGFPLTKAFLHVAGLTAILSITVVLIFYHNYKEYKEVVLPGYQEFYEKGFPEDLYFEDGKVIYDAPSPYHYSAKVLGNKLGIIVDTSGSTEEIPEGYVEVILVTADKVFLGNSKKKSEINLPEERISAREFFIQIRQVNTTMLIAMGTQYFTMIFAAAAVVIGVLSVIIYITLGMKIHKLSFYGQLNICCFASTPFFAGALGIQGISHPYAVWTLLGVCSLLFILLAVLGTREFMTAGASEPGVNAAVENKESG